MIELYNIVDIILNEDYEVRLIVHHESRNSK